MLEPPEVVRPGEPYRLAVTAGGNLLLCHRRFG
jgi:hypothetical protein